MNIDKYFVPANQIPDDIYIEGEGLYICDGIEYHDAESFIIEHMFGFCGCGNPTSVIHYISNTLQHIADLQDLVWTDKLTYHDWRADEILIHGSAGAATFIYYVLDKKGFTEHGCSVPGWLTDAGKELLSDLKEIIGKDGKKCLD